MSTTQQPKPKASVDDIVQQLTWLNENVAAFAKRHEEYLTTMHARAAATRKHMVIERIVQGVLCGLVFLLAIGATSTSVSGNLAELTAQNAAATKAIVPSLIAVMAAIGVWRSIKTQPPSVY